MDNYTNLPIGQKVDRGDIQVCPYCGRRGIAEKVNEMTFFTHSQWALVNAEGNPEIGWDMCPKQTITVTTPRPKDL